MPSRPANGARNVFFATSAACAAACARLALQIRGIGVELRLADRLRLELHLVARVDGRGQVRRRLQGVQLRDVRVRIQLDQHRTALRLVTGLEVQGAHQARNLGGDIHAVNSAHAADRGDLGLPVRVCRDRGAHGLRRRRFFSLICATMCCLKKLKPTSAASSTPAAPNTMIKRRRITLLTASHSSS